MNDFIWPSDQDRADNDELNRVCEYAEQILDQNRDLLFKLQLSEESYHACEAGFNHVSLENRELQFYIERLCAFMRDQVLPTLILVKEDYPSSLSASIALTDFDTLMNETPMTSLQIFTERERNKIISDFVDYLFNDNWCHQISDDEEMEKVVVDIIKSGDGFFYAEGLKIAAKYFIDPKNKENNE